MSQRKKHQAQKKRYSAKMMRNKKKYNKLRIMIRIILYIALLYSLVNSSYAISLGVSPSRVIFKEMLRSGYAESLAIRRGYPETMGIRGISIMPAATLTRR